jgi:hypothetical protein
MFGHKDRDSPPTEIVIPTRKSAAAGPTVRDVENVKSQVDALMQAMNDSVGRLRTDLATVQTAPVPIGTVVSSLIPIAQFQALHGTFSASGMWMFADGRDVTGSEYAKITGSKTVPDLRGAYLRMAGTNAARTGWNGGNANTYVEDSTKRPTTAFTGTFNDPRTNNGSARGITGSSAWSSAEAYLYPGTSTVSITGGGDAETRPKTYAVNYYIRIN